MLYSHFKSNHNISLYSVTVILGLKYGNRRFPLHTFETPVRGRVFRVLQGHYNTLKCSFVSPPYKYMHFIRHSIIQNIGQLYRIFADRKSIKKGKTQNRCRDRLCKRSRRQILPSWWTFVSWVTSQMYTRSTFVFFLFIICFFIFLNKLHSTAILKT